MSRTLRDVWVISNLEKNLSGLSLSRCYCKYTTVIIIGLGKQCLNEVGKFNQSIDQSLVGQQATYI